MGVDHFSEGSAVLATVLAMLIILALAAFVALYVAFPHRDQEVPGAPWLGDAMRRGVDALPVLEDEVTSHDGEPLNLHEGFTRS